MSAQIKRIGVIMIKRIGMLTSGGDCQAMNAAVRAVVLSARKYNIEVVGISDAYYGMTYNRPGDFRVLHAADVENIINLGGTILNSARFTEFGDDPEYYAKLMGKNLEANGIGALVVIGGDGSFRGSLDIHKYTGIPCIGIPATIDNDIVSTEYTLGFDTALRNTIEMCDALRDTCNSHKRCNVVEVMGRNAGHLALYVGLATGATAVLVPEKPVNFDSDVIDRIRQARLAGNTHFMIIVAEGAGSAIEIGKGIHEELGLDPRVTILGHIQRGGTPSARDRVMASRMGYHAGKTLADGKTNRVICARAGQMVDIDITEGLSMKKGLNEQQYEVLQAMTGIDN